MSMSVLSANFRRDLEIRRYPFLVYLLVPLASLVLQAWLPRVAGHYSWFDLPLIITVYFALARRSPVHGTMLGAIIGLFEDALSHRAIGVNGVAKTIVGFIAASVGIRIDVENQIIRLLITFLLSLLSSAICIFVYRVLLGLEYQWQWFTELFIAIGNAALAVVFFPLLDRLGSKE